MIITDLQRTLLLHFMCLNFILKFDKLMYSRFNVLAKKVNNDSKLISKSSVMAEQKMVLGAPNF
jgi:hypothetical protein